jgi:hypothetical protein
MLRAVTAFVLHPFLLFALYVGGVYLLGLQAEPFNYATVTGIGTWFVVGTFYLLVFPGLPLFVLGIRMRWLSIWYALTAGASAGLVLAAIPAIGMLFDDKLHLHYRLEQLVSTYPFAALGAVGGALLWLLAIWRNPALVRKPKSASSGTSSAA